LRPWGYLTKGQRGEDSMITDSIDYVAGQPYYVHICDFCIEKCDDGRGWRYEEGRDITICQGCIAKYAAEFALPNIQPAPSPTSPVIPMALRWEVWERDNFTCKICGSRRDLTIDHIIPAALGGQTTKENLQTLCRRCNSRKKDTVGESLSL